MGLAVMIDGQLRAPAEATVSVFDRGFLYGDSVFETVRTYSGKAFALGEHLERLSRSASKVFIPLPVAASQIRSEVLEVLAAAGNDESYVRIMLTRGQGSMGLDPALAERPLRVIIADELKPLPPIMYEQGVNVVSFKTLRPSDMTDAEGAKIGNYLVAVLAMRVAREQNAHEALIADAGGRVVEGASSNIFFVSGGRLCTPPLDAGILAGITRDRVLRVAEELGMEVAFESPSLAALKAADEVFISSSIRELLPVVSIDGDAVGEAQPGPITGRLRSGFLALVERELSLG